MVADAEGLEALLGQLVAQGERLLAQGERLVALGESQLALVEQLRARAGLRGARPDLAREALEGLDRVAIDRDAAWQRRALEVRIELAGAVARRGVPVPDVAALDELVTRCRLQGVIGAVIDQALTLDEAADRLADRMSKDRNPKGRRELVRKR